MRTHIISLSIITFLFLVVTHSCKKETISPDTEPAMLRLNIGVKVVEMDVYKVKKSAFAIEDYRVEIRNSQGDIVLEYDRAEDMPLSIELVPGTYTVIAHSNNLTYAAFNSPYYYGEKEITLLEGESKTETVTCSLANCAVRIVYSQNITDGFDSYSTVVSNLDGGSLTFDEDETRLGYFSLSAISIEATLTNSTETKTLTGSIANPEAQKLYEVQLDASASDVTEVTISLIEDGTTSTEVVVIGESQEISTPEVGDLIFSEIMADPALLSDTEGEYFEIYNTSSFSININGLIFKEGLDTKFTVDEDIVVPSNGYATFARSSSVTFTADFVSSSISLNNDGEQIGLYFDINTVETEISSLDFSSTGFPSPTGKSMELSTNHLNATDAVDGTYWCTAVSEISAGGDLGTPGATNDCN